MLREYRGSLWNISHLCSFPSRAAQIFLELITTYQVSPSPTIDVMLSLNPASQNRGVQVHFAHVHPRAQEVFRKAGIIKAAGEDHFHRSVLDHRYSMIFTDLYSINRSVADAMQHLKDVIISTRH
jgi:hypothetical protein